MIPFALPSLGDEELTATADVIRSNWILQGPRVAEFERLMADYCGTRHSVAVSSCTTALHLALNVLGIGLGDEVICPSLSFIATANCICHAGATPIFADVDAATYNLTPEAVEPVITPRTRAILLVHQMGLPADIDRFRSLAERRGLLLLEDAACALGSRYKGQPIGGHTEMACFSFHPRKVITTGEGGVITTNNDVYAEKLRILRQHGMNASVAERHGSHRVVFEDYLYVGYNYRMTDLQAAVGVVQMKRLDELLGRRRHLGKRYNAALAAHPWLRAPAIPDYAEPNYQSYAVHLAADAPFGRNELMQWLLDRGIHTRRGIMVSHRETPYRDRPLVQPLPQSERASDASLILPLYPALTEGQQDEIIGALEEAARLRHRAKAG